MALNGNKLYIMENMLCEMSSIANYAYSLADPGGGPPARPPPPQQDQFLSFSHMFSPKSGRMGGWRPPNGKYWIRH